MNELTEKSFEEEIDDISRYRPGMISYEYDPAKEKYKNMLHLIAYDIREPKRLRKIAAVCLDFGIRVEYSVFECDLSESDFDAFWNRLKDTMDENDDRILAYRICGSCVTRIESMGDIVRPCKPLVYIF